MSPAHKTRIAPTPEIAKFDDLASDWWNPQGAMAPLHRLNPARLTFILGALEAHFDKIEGVSLLDVGCGGGLVAEPLARQGAKVTGLDGAGELIEVAKKHAATQKLSIDYVHGMTPDLIAKKKTFDVVLALEVIEHVDDAQKFVSDIAKLLKPGGIAIFSTLNRTARSFAFGIVAAEYLLRWLPTGTHDWRKFVKPSELHELCAAAKLKPNETMGLIYHPVTKEFQLNPRDLAVNYFLTAVK